MSNHDQNVPDLVLDGSSLSVEVLERFLDGAFGRISVCPDALPRVSASSQQLLAWAREGKPIYGVTRGLGPLKDRALSLDESVEFQRRILLSHATGFGEVFEDEIARLALLIRTNVYCIGTFGIRPELIWRMTDLLNAEVVPQMPVQGSLGSGDLQPMAALGLVVSGDKHGVAKLNGETAPAPEILTAAGLEAEFELQTEEALSLISGSTVLAAGAVYALRRIRRHIALLDAAYALTLEAVRGETGALDPRIHDARGIPGQIESARAARALLEGSEWAHPDGRERLGETAPRVQDSVSLRSSPHIHGALRELYDFSRVALDRELNASTLNPLMFPSLDANDDYDVLMGGNYDGSYLAHLLDFLNIALTDCAGLSATRSARLISPRASYGLPPNLAGGRPGLNSGLVQVQSLQVSIQAQMRQQAAPASIHSLSAKDMQEDHNSMGNGSLYDLLVNLDRCDTVIAIEFLLATSALSLIAPDMAGLRLGAGTEVLWQFFCGHIDPIEDDRFFQWDARKSLELIQGPHLVDLVRGLTGSED